MAYSGGMAPGIGGNIVQWKRMTKGMDTDLHASG